MWELLILKKNFESFVHPVDRFRKIKLCLTFVNIDSDLHLNLGLKIMYVKNNLDYDNER